MTKKERKGTLPEIFMKKETYQQIALILSFVLPVTVVLCIFILKGIYPFGDRSFLFSDMYHQYMPFFREFLHKIRAGEGLSYSYNVGIGSNFLALYVYYLASPLHWLAFLVPEAHLMEFMSYLVVVKLGLCGLTSFLYLQKRSFTGDPAALFFSCFYAMSGFIAAYNWNIMWLDCVILMPLILLGLEKLVKEGKGVFYCVMLTLSILTNFYISIMICIFLVLYFVVLLFTERFRFCTVGKFILYSLLAGGMASVLLIPEVCAILATDFGDISFPKTLVSYFSVLDMLARHCMCVVTERGLEHWPNVYCGSAVLLMMPLYVVNDRIPIRKRFLSLALAGFLLLSFSTNILDFVWHGLNYPDSLPARQSFCYILLVLTMCYEAYLAIRDTPKKQILYGYLGAVVFLLFCEKFIDSEDFETGIKVMTLLFVTFYAAALYLYRTRTGNAARMALGILTLIVVTVESSVNLYNTSIGTTSRLAYLGQLEDYRALYAYALEQEPEFFRMEKFTRKTKNDGTLAGYPTASVFSSTMNSRVMDLYKRWGMRHSKVYYGFDGATAFTSALLNVHWMFAEKDEAGEFCYENTIYAMRKESGDIGLYACKAVLPFGYVAPYGYDLPESGNGIYLQNQMVKQLGIGEELFLPAKSSSEGNDVRITAKRDGIHYALLTSKNSQVSVIGGELGDADYKDLKDGSILYLGYLYEGESVTLTNGDEEDETPKITAGGYVMDEEVLGRAITALSQNCLTEVSYDSTHISGSLSLEEPGRMILSVPYEKGWTVTVNGEKTEPALFGECFLALDLEAGEYEIALKYVPWGRNAGILVSTVSLAVFLLIIFGQKLKKSKINEKI